jgi:hypothetical protein
MTEYSFNDLVDEAGEAAGDAADGQDTGEWIRDTVELLEKRGLLEPIIFGPEGAEQLAEQQDAGVEGGDVGGDVDGDDLDAATIADAGEAIMAELGEDVEVAEVVKICEANPDLVNQKLGEHL